MKVLALDVGGTAIKSALIQDGRILETSERPSDGKLGGPYVIQNMMNTIDSYRNYDIIGISTTGQVDSERGYIIYANENVPDYTGTFLKSQLEEKYHKPVCVENDVNAAAIGEGFYGAGKGEKDFLCLTYGTGIGGAIIIDKKLYKGSQGLAGEMGHIITHINGLPCSCGRKGCYEQYASTTALIKKAVAYDESLSDGIRIFNQLEKSCCPQKFYNPQNGNTKVKEIIDSWIDEIIWGLVSLIHIFNPSCIILGGGIMKQKYILTSVNTKIRDYIMDSFKNIRITAAELGNNAGIFGMAAIAGETYPHLK